MTVLVETLTGIAESIMLYMIYEAFFIKKENIPLWVYPVCYLLYAALSDLSFWFLGGTLVNVFILYAGSVLMAFLYRCDMKSKIATPLFVYTLNILIEMLVWYLVGLFFDTNTMHSGKEPDIWIVGAVLSKTLLLFIMNFIRLRFKNKKLFSNRNYWLLFIVVFLPTALIEYLLFLISLTTSDSYLYVFAIVGSLGLVISSFVVLFLYESFSAQAESVNREQQYKQQIKSQTKHLDEILVMQNQLKSFRHDIKNHWVVLSGYFQKKDFDGGMAYIDEMSKKLSGGEIVDTGNIALDAIVSTKKALAQKKGITFESTIQVPEKLPIEAVDICILFGNAIDNAIEACEKVKSGEKHVRLSVIYDGDSVLCKISNTVSNGKRISLKTTKADKDNHGYGLENIKQALAGYNHLMKIDLMENEFVLSFIIFNK